ncbi:MAG: sulfite exporter TauE/SafE family protein [Nitrososphaerales archaeon]
MRTRDIPTTFGVGLVTGFVAGLVGLGGAELRIPFILYLFGIQIRQMIPLNLLISLITSGSSFLVRWQSGLLPLSSIPLSASMIIGSIGGGFLGSKISNKVSVRKLEAFLALILSIVIIRLLVELFVEGEPTRVFPEYLELPFAAVFGLGIGVIAGSVGVAGGEYRIPALMFLFGSPIKIAGTISQLVSIPTVVISILKHNQHQIMDRRLLWVGATMGVGSLVGVLLSGLVILDIPDALLNSVFILILTYTVVKLVQDLFKVRRS